MVFGTLLARKSFSSRATFALACAFNRNAQFHSSRIARDQVKSHKSSFSFGRFLWPSIAGISVWWLGKPNEKYPEQENQNFILGYLSRSKNRLADFFYGFQEPAFEKFLPDKPQSATDQHAKKYTLVIDLDNFLVSHQWDTKHGKWKVAKRPGADMFLFYMAQYYEVVLFSSMSQQEGEMILQKLDPYGCISYRLYRFATRFEKGKYYKDIGRLNRDLSKVVVFGCDEIGFSPHAENFLPTAPWNGKDESSSLENYIDFFEALAVSNADDLRKIVAKYQGKQVDSAYNELQRKLYNDMKLQHENLAQRKKNNIFLRLFASGASHNQQEVPAFEQKKEMLMELRRKEYQNAKKIMDEQLEKERKRQEEYLKQNKVTMWDLAVGGAAAVGGAQSSESGGAVGDHA